MRRVGAILLRTLPVLVARASRAGAAHSAPGPSHSRRFEGTQHTGKTKRPQHAAADAATGDLLRRLQHQGSQRPSPTAAAAEALDAVLDVPLPRVGGGVLSGAAPISPEALFNDDSAEDTPISTGTSSCAVGTGGLTPPEAEESEEAFYGTTTDSDSAAAAAASSIDAVELELNQEFVAGEGVVLQKDTEGDSVDGEEDPSSLLDDDETPVIDFTREDEEADAEADGKLEEDDLSVESAERLLDAVASSSGKRAAEEFTFFQTAKASSVRAAAAKAGDKPGGPSSTSGAFDDSAAVFAELESVGEDLPSPER